MKDLVRQLRAELETVNQVLDNRMLQLRRVEAELETAKRTLFQTEKRLDDKLRTALAELEAAQKQITMDTECIERIRKHGMELEVELEAARKERDAWRDSFRKINVKLINLLHAYGAGETEFRDGEKIDEMVTRIVSERDTALAAKDAAEKRAAELEGALKVADDRLHYICGSAMAIANGESEKEFWKAIDGMGPDMTVVRNALTSAPTQETPAGIVNDNNS